MATYVRVLPDGTVTGLNIVSASQPTMPSNKGRWALLADVPPAFVSGYQTRTRTVPANVPTGDVTVQYSVADKPLATFKAERKMAAKMKARSIILAAYPDWKQANMTARAVELLKIGQSDNAEGLALQAAWDWIKAIRAYSDALETAIDGAANAQAVAAVDIETGWPA